MGQSHKSRVMQRWNEKAACNASTFRNMEIFLFGAIFKRAPPLRKNHDQPRRNGQMWPVRVGSERFECFYPFIATSTLIKFFSLFFCSNPYLMFNFRVWNCNKMPRLMVGARRRSTGGADTGLYNGLGNGLAVKISDTMASLQAVLVNLSFAQHLLVTAWHVTRKIKCLIGDFFPVKTHSPPARIMAVIHIVNWATTLHNRKLQLSWKLNPKNATNKSAARSWLKTLKSSWRYPHDMSFINKQLESHIRWFQKC